MRKINVTEKDLLKIVKVVLREQDYTSDVERPTSDREKEIRGAFGDKYSKYLPNDVVRYMRKNPAQLFKKLYDIYGENAFKYLINAKENIENEKD